MNQTRTAFAELLAQPGGRIAQDRDPAPPNESFEVRAEDDRGMKAEAGSRRRSHVPLLLTVRPAGCLPAGPGNVRPSPRLPPRDSGRRVFRCRKDILVHSA